EPRCLDPHRHLPLAEARVATGRAEVEDLLARGPDPLAEQGGEEPGEPGPAREDEELRREPRAVGERDRGEPSARGRRRRGEGLAVLAALGEEPLEDLRAGAAREEEPRLLLEEGPADAVEADLRIAPRRLRERELLVGEAVLLEEGNRIADEVAFVGDH